VAVDGLGDEDRAELAGVDLDRLLVLGGLMYEIGLPPIDEPAD
jgi:hypothetical protein